MDLMKHPCVGEVLTMYLDDMFFVLKSPRERKEGKEGRQNSEFEAKSIVDTVTKSKRTDERHINVDGAMLNIITDFRLFQ